MNRKWIWIVPALAWLLFLQPLKAEAKTSVYVSFGVGGAVIVGGAFIAWGISYGSRVSNGGTGTTPVATLVHTPTKFQQPGYQDSFDRFNQDLFNRNDTEGPRDLAIGLPLFTYRW